jgi:hypothetical protein
MADVHLWGGKYDRWDENSHTTPYLTLCGVPVVWGELAYDRIGRPIEPTCMGCILVKFQQKAERAEQHNGT